MTKPDLVEEAARAHGEFADSTVKDNLGVIILRALERVDAAAEQRGREEAQKVSRADLAAGWEIVGLPREGQHICWVIDPAELIPTLQSLIDQGTMIGSVLPVAAIRRGTHGTAPPSSPSEQNGESATPSHARRGET